MELICTHDCFWLSLIKEGETITVEKEEEVPPSVRPYFEDKDKLDILKVKTGDEEVDEVERLRAEFEKAGKPYDRRWSKITLENKLQLIKRDI